MESMKKLVVQIAALQDDKDKQKAMKTVSALQGIDIIAMDMKGKKITVIGTMDPVEVVSKLRKHWQTDIISVGPAKEPEKKEEAKPEDAAKKEESAKEETNKKEGGEQQKKEQEAKKGEEPNKEEPKKEEPKKEEETKIRAEPVNLELVRAYRPYYNPYMANYYYAHQSMEENPNACVIC